MELLVSRREESDAEAATDGSHSKIIRNTEHRSLPSIELSALFESLTIHPDSLPAPSNLVHRYRTEEIPRLQALLPMADIPDSCGLVTAAHCSSMHIRLLIYAVTNNLAGLEDFEGRASASFFILQYLETLSTGLLRAYRDTYMRQALFREFPSMRPLTEALFKAAVTTGNAFVARQILSWQESGVEVDQFVFRDDRSGERFTALEIAAHRQNLPLVKVLVDYGADLNACGCQGRSPTFMRVHKIGDTWTWYKEISIVAEARACGGLECALCPELTSPAWWEPSEYNDDLVTYLVTRGAKLHPIKDGLPCEYLLNQMTLTGHDKTVDVLVRHLIDATNQSEWMESGFFHLAFMTLEQSSLLCLVDLMLEWKCDLGYCMGSQEPSSGDDTFPRFVYDTRHMHSQTSGVRKYSAPLGLQRPFSDLARLRYIVDICAARGHMDLIDRLPHTVVLCNSDTLSLAIAAGHVEMAQFFMRDDQVDMCQYSSLLETTPYAEAIFLRDPFLLRTTAPSTTNMLDLRSYTAAIRASAAVGDLEMIRVLLEWRNPVHSNMKARSKALGLALAEACHQDRADVAMILLEAGADPSQEVLTSMAGRSVVFSTLGLAANINDQRLVNALIDHGATDVKMSMGRDSFSMRGAVARAATNGNTAMLKLLVSARYHSIGAIEYAVEHGHVDVLEEMLALGLSLSSGALYDAVRSRNLGLVHLLLTQDEPYVWKHLIKDAVRSGDEAIVEALCNRVLIDFSKYDHESKSAILTGLVEGKYQNLLGSFLRALGTLAASCPRASERITWLAQPLAATIQLESDRAQAMAKMILEAGADVDGLLPLIDFGEDLNPRALGRADVRAAGQFCGTSNERVMSSSLLDAIFLRKQLFVDLLIEFGADVNLHASGGRRRTPLQQAAESGSYAIVEKLITHGADLNAPPAVRGGGTALQLAAIKGYIGIFELLVSHGADICAAPSLVNGRTAIEGAAEWGRFDMVSYLASQVRIPGEQLVKAKEKAQENGHTAIVDKITSMLLERSPRPLHTIGLTGSLASPRIGLAGLFSNPAIATSYSQRRDEDAPSYERRRSNESRRHEVDPPFCLSDGVSGVTDGMAQQLSAYRGEVAALQTGVNERIVEVCESADGLSWEDDSTERVASKSTFVCRHCQTQVCNASSLSRHMRSKHASPTAQDAYRCNQCNRRFPRKDLRDRHQATHDKNVQMYEPCPECHRRHRKDYLKKHIPLCRTKAASRLAQQGAMATMLSTFQLFGESSAEH